MDLRNKEIRTILMGFINYADVYIVAADNVLSSSFKGLFQGASAARIRGLKEVRRQYRLPAGKVYGNTQIVEAFLSLGSPVFLNSAPDASGILFRPLLANPVMITVEAEKSDALVCLYTAKSIYAPLVFRRVIRKLEKAFPQNFKQTEVTMTPFVAGESETKEEKPEPKKKAKEKKKSKSDAPEQNAVQQEAPAQEQKADAAESAPTEEQKTNLD